MHALVKDLTGLTFGILTVIKYVGVVPNGKRTTTSLWECECKCSAKVLRTAYSLRYAKLRNCESSCSKSCKFRASRMNKKFYIKVGDRAKYASPVL